MDTNKMTKQELIELIEKYEKEFQKFDKFGDIEATIKLKDEAIRNEHELRKKITSLESYIKEVEEQRNGLGSKLNVLAGILEEYVTAFEDQIKISGSIQRSNTYVQNALRQKIEIFNKGEEK